MLSVRCVHGVLRTLRQLAISMLLCPGQKEVSWMSRISFHEQKFKQNFPHFWAMLKAENAKRTGRNWPKPNHRAILQNPPMVRWCIWLTLVCEVTRYNWLKSEKKSFKCNILFRAARPGVKWPWLNLYRLWIIVHFWNGWSWSGTFDYHLLPCFGGRGGSAGVALELNCLLVNDWIWALPLKLFQKMTQFSTEKIPFTDLMLGVKLDACRWQSLTD